MKTMKIIAIFVFVGLIAAEASASSQRFEWTGRVERIYDELDRPTTIPGIEVGDVFLGTILYDTDRFGPGVGSDSHRDYAAPSGLTMTLTFEGEFCCSRVITGVSVGGAVTYDQWNWMSGGSVFFQANDYSNSSFFPPPIPASFSEMHTLFVNNLYKFTAAPKFSINFGVPSKQYRIYLDQQFFSFGGHGFQGIPNVVGMTLDEARFAISDAGFVVWSITYANSNTVPQGNVISQDPAAGTEVLLGTNVDLVISSGPSGGPGVGGLVAHYKLDENTGTNAADSSSNGNNGTLYGGPVWQPTSGMIDGALQFDGVNDCVDLGYKSAFNPTGGFSIALWANIENWSTDWQHTLIGNRSDGVGWCLRRHGPWWINLYPSRYTQPVNALCFTTRGVGNLGDGVEDSPSNTVPPFNEWVHIACIYDNAKNMKYIYFDGEQNAAWGTNPGTVTPATQKVYLGARSNEGNTAAEAFFKGMLDDVRIYSRALSSGEISRIISSDAASCLVGYWKLDETIGTVANDSAGTKHGTLYGSPTWQPTGGKINGALRFDGSNDYVALPIGSLISSLTNSTFATWVNWSGTGGLWQRVFDFGSGISYNMFLTPTNLEGRMRFAITTGGGGAEDRTTAMAPLPTGWHHVAVTMDAVNKIHKLYLDGAVVATKTSARYTPSSLGNTTQNWLGKSQYQDPYFNGSLDDFRIYARALSASEVVQLVGGGETITADIVIGDFEQSMEAWGPTWETPAPAFSYSTTGVTLGQRSLAIKPNKNGFQWSFMYTGLVDLETYKKLSVDVTWVAAEWGATPWCNFKEVVINSDGPSGWKQYIPNDTVNPDWPGSWDPVGWGNHTRILTWDFSGYNATGATWMQIIFSTNFGGSTPGKYYIDNVRLISE